MEIPPPKKTACKLFKLIEWSKVVGYRKKILLLGMHSKEILRKIQGYNNADYWISICVGWQSMTDNVSCSSLTVDNNVVDVECYEAMHRSI